MSELICLRLETLDESFSTSPSSAVAGPLSRSGVSVARLRARPCVTQAERH